MCSMFVRISLLMEVVLHRLLHPVNGFPQGGDNLPQVGVALLGKFFLALLQQFVRGGLHLRLHVVHRLVEARLEGGHAFFVPFFLGGQHGLGVCLFVFHLCLQHFRLALQGLSFVL